MEAHIEQGSVLWQRGFPIGIPNGIVGIARYNCSIYGEANHAGTTPMTERKDALYESVALLHQWLDYMRGEPEMVCNVAEITLVPNQIGVVNGQVDFLVEIRSMEGKDTVRAADLLQNMLMALKTCRGEMNCVISKPSVKLDDRLIEMLWQTGLDCGLELLPMQSGASHDASPLSQVMPTAMVFVPSVGGISHNKDEFTKADDLTRGAMLLANAILRIDAQYSISG